jgi:hypothetical protein
MEKEENYYLPLHWQPFNPETTDMDDYFVGIKRTVSNVLVVHEVLESVYTWVPITKKWISNDGASYNLGEVVCVAKKYPIVFPKTFRE